MRAKSTKKKSPTKKEIESANEELTTTNHEMQIRNDLLNEAYGYSEALFATIHEPMLVLDKNLRVKSANKTFYKIFKVKEKETEGVLLYDLGNGQWNIPRLRELLEDVLPKNSHFYDFEITHTFPVIGERIMLLNANRIVQKANHEELILLSINDVTEVRKKALELLGAENKYLSRFQHLLLQTPVAIAIYRGSKYIVELVNDSGLELLVKDKSLIGKLLFEAMPELENPIKEIFDKIMETGIPFTAKEMEVTLFRNGRNETGWFNINYQPIREDDNTISGILTSSNEVTDQVLARRKIEDSEKRYNMMLMKSQFAFAVLKGKNKVITMANDRVKKIWGKGMDIEGKSLFDIIPELKDTPFPAILDEVYDTGIPFHGVDIQSPKAPLGELKDEYFNFVFQPYLEADETISGITIIGYEVTASVMVKKALEAQHEAEQKALKQIADSEKRYNMMLMKSPFAFAILKGKDMVLAMANDSIKEMWGKGNEIEGKPLIEVLPELKGQGFTELLNKVYTTGIPYIANEALAKVKRNGKMEDVYFNFVYQPYRETDDTISGVTIIAIEVTNEVLAKQKIKDSQQQLQNIFMQAPFALNIYEGKELVISLANKLFCEIIGKTESEILGKKLFDAFPETATQGLDKILSDIFSTGIPFRANEFPVHFLKHGNEFKGYFDFIYQPIFDYNKNVSGVINVAIDVTDKVLARKKIEESEQRFHNLIYTSPSAIGILVGEDLVITIANEPIIEIWGKGKEILGKKYFEALPELAEQGYKEVFNQVYKTGIPFNAIETPVSILQNGVTTLKYYNFILYPQKNINGEINGIGIIATEVTSQAEYNLRIKESEERFRSLVVKAPYPICIFKGKELKMEVANEFMLKIYNVGEEVLGTPFLEILPEMKEQPFIALLLDVLENGTTHSGSEQPAYFLRKNGEKETYYFNFVYQPYRENDGAISGIMVLATDVTEQVMARYKIEESEKKFKQLAELMPQKVWTADANGNKIYFNKTLLDFAGKTLEELKGDGWREMIHPDDWEQDETKWNKSVNTGNTYQSESRFLRKDGKYIWHLTMAVPLKDEQDNIILWIGSKTEIQEQRQQKEILEELVTSRTAELKQANEELVKMNKELEAFTYVSSHDLQEPLRKIQTFAGRILEKENSNLSDTGKNYFRLMKNAAQRMQTLINDLLAFSRLSTSERKFENTDLRIIIDEVKKEFEEAIEKKHATIEANQICEVDIIPFQFRQLMHNLIGNALMFTNPDRPPHIKITSVNTPYSKLNIEIQSPQKEYCHITISDNGIGFEKEFSEKIFEVFQRLHGKDEYAGTGIGLAIVKKIVDNHNGIITATGKLNEGATFDIYIPVLQNR